MSDFIDEMIKNSPEWICTENAESDIDELSRLTGFSRRVAKILWNREIRRQEDLDRYLRGDIYALHNPFIFKNMMEIVQRVRKAVYKEEKIFIFGDRDADGVLSTAMLFNMLSRFDADVIYRVPEGEFGYGIEKHDVDFAGNEGVSLIITVDTGISSAEEIVYAKSLGIDTIVMDHHVQPDTVPQAFAILNPKMKDEQYPFCHLSAGGVVLKFIHAFILSHTKNIQKSDVFIFKVGQQPDLFKKFITNSLGFVDDQ